MQRDEHDFYFNVARSEDRSYRDGMKPFSALHKFGRNDATGTTFSPVCMGGVYPTPSATVDLEVVSSDVNDTLAGTGARKVTLQGLDANFQLKTVTVEMNGTTAVDVDEDANALTFIRLFRAWVSDSGVYSADPATGSHVGTITIRVDGGGATWLEIDATAYPVGQSEAAFYTVPAGYKLYLNSLVVTVDSTKATTLLLLRRNNADDVTAGYAAWRALQSLAGLIRDKEVRWQVPIEITGPADIGVMAKVNTGTAAVSVNFDAILMEA